MVSIYQLSPPHVYIEGDRASIYDTFCDKQFISHFFIQPLSLLWTMISPPLSLMIKAIISCHPSQVLRSLRRSLHFGSTYASDLLKTKIGHLWKMKRSLLAHYMLLYCMLKQRNLHHLDLKISLVLLHSPSKQPMIPCNLYPHSLNAQHCQYHEGFSLSSNNHNSPCVCLCLLGHPHLCR